MRRVGATERCMLGWEVYKTKVGSRGWGEEVLRHLALIKRFLSKIEFRLVSKGKDEYTFTPCPTLPAPTLCAMVSPIENKARSGNIKQEYGGN